jgi:hypothetical protein
VKGPRLASTTVTIGDQKADQIRELLNILRITEKWMSHALPRVEPKSAFAGDDARTTRHEVSQAVHHALNIAVDHLHCLRMALTGQGGNTISLHAHAPFTLIRAALENAAVAVWLAAPAKRQERITRRLRLEMRNIDEIKQMLKAADSLDLKDVQDRTDTVNRLTTQANIDPSAVRQRPAYSEIVKLASEVAELSDADHNLGYLFWKMCSAFAHGDRWTISLLDLEQLGVVSPGVSTYRVTAPTESVLGGVRGAIAMIMHGQRLHRFRVQSHMTLNVANTQYSRLH